MIHFMYACQFVKTITQDIAMNSKLHVKILQWCPGRDMID